MHCMLQCPACRERTRQSILMMQVYNCMYKPVYTRHPHHFLFHCSMLLFRVSFSRLTSLLLQCCVDNSVTAFPHCNTLEIVRPHGIQCADQSFTMNCNEFQVRLEKVNVVVSKYVGELLQLNCAADLVNFLPTKWLVVWQMFRVIQTRLKPCVPPSSLFCICGDACPLSCVSARVRKLPVRLGTLPLR